MTRDSCTFKSAGFTNAECDGKKIRYGETTAFAIDIEKETWRFSRVLRTVLFFSRVGRPYQSLSIKRGADEKFHFVLQF